MNTRQLYYLVTIAESGSLSAAAQVLNISQPALSRFLSEYEDQIGYPLFLRYHRNLMPTSIGQYVIDSAQKILNEQTRMLQTIRSVTNSDHAQIRMATAPNRGAIIYSQIYNDFSRRYPDISLTLTELYASEQPSAILHGQIDLSIGAGLVSDKVTDIPIAYEELLVSLPASHPLADAEAISLADLRDTPFVLQGPRHSIRILAEQLFAEAGFHPVVVFESNDVILVDSMLHQAVGAGLVSQAHTFPCEELVYRPLNPPIHQTLHIRYPKGHVLTEPERYLAGLLVRERLSDPRYKPIRSPEVKELLELSETELSGNLPSHAPAKTSDAVPAQAAPEINLNPQLLRYLLSIVDEKSLTRAAEVHYLTQPALSRHLRHAERMLSAQLFSRVHNRLQPTNAGKVFANFARNMLQINAEMTRQIRAYRSGHEGTIYLQCDPLLTPIVEKQVLPAFQAEHPTVHLVIRTGGWQENQEALLNTSSDLGLYYSPTRNHPILMHHLLVEDHLLYCAKPDSPVRPSGSEDGVPLHAPELLPIHPMMMALSGTALRAEQERICAEQLGIRPQAVCEAGMEILRFLSEHQIADSILPAGLLTDRARAAGLAFSRPEPFYLLLAYHPGHTLPAPAKDLIQMLREEFCKEVPTEGK